MNIGFPINTIILILATMVAVGISAWVLLSQGIRRLATARDAQRLLSSGLAILLGAWLTTRAVLAAFSLGGEPFRTQFNITLASLILGMAAGLAPLLLSTSFRQIVSAIPQTWLIGVHSIRLGGFLFLALLDMRLLPATFALSAGYGDITTGLLALGLVYLFHSRPATVRPLAVAWNLLGLLDFVSALTTGYLYLTPFATELAATGVSIGYLNYVLIVPAFGVSVYAVLHLYSLYQLLPAHAEHVQPGQDRHQAQAPAD